MTPNSTPSALNDTDLLFGTLPEISTALKKRQISSVDLTTLYLARLETLGPKLGALAHLTRPLALVQAAQADRERMAGKVRGPLHGIPFGVKDLLATANDPTEWGSPAHAGQVFDYDAAAVAAPGPEEEPPAQCSRFQGVLPGPVEDALPKR